MIWNQLNYIPEMQVVFNSFHLSIVPRNQRQHLESLIEQ